MKKFIVTVKGIGQAGSSPRQINETIEIDDAIRADIMSSSRKAATLEALLLTKCPGVTVDGNKLGYNIEEVNAPLIKKETIKEFATAASAGAIAGAAVSKKRKKNETKKNEPDKESDPIGVRVRMISDFVWKDDLENTIEKLKYIALETTGHKWVISPKTNVDKENNRILSKCYKQYKIGYRHYKNLVEYKELKGNLKRFKLKLIFSKYLFLSIPSILIMLFLLIVLLNELSRHF